MYTTITASSQFKIYAAVALAALLMTLLAVTLTAGQAQATTTTTIADSGDDNSIPQQQDTTPRHATPEACPGETGNTNEKAASVVDSGHYALFDVWWNDEEGELTNTVCPPSITYVPSQTPVPPSFGNPGKPGTPARTDRAASSIDITAEPPTIIHIPSGARVNLKESTEYTETKYPEVWHADDAENPDGDGDRMVWVLPACPPDGDPSEVGLCVSYSAALLNSADWNGNIEYIVTHVHQVDIDKQDRRYVLAYDVPEAGPQLRWYSANQEADTVNVAPGGYDRPMWFFPSRGAYEFQVYIRGNPNTTKSDPVSKDASVTSDFRMYILHVGAEADLSTTVNVTPQNPSPTNEVTITITASNAAGKDAAPDTKVEVSLPEGLTYSSHDAPTGTSYNSTTGDWTWNEDISLASGASKTLTIKATVDAGTHGETLTAEAAISATETVTTNSGDYDVPVPDPDPTNNTDTGTVTVASSANVDPIFTVAGSVPEYAPDGVLVGDPIKVKEPNSGDTLTYGLSGGGAQHFTVSAVEGGAQVSVTGDETEQLISYSENQSFDLVLTVSDGKDANGNDDASVDSSIGMRVEVLDFTVSMTADRTSATVGQSVTFTVTLENPPKAESEMHYTWEERVQGAEQPVLRKGTGNPGTFTATRSTPGTMEYTVGFWYPHDGYETGYTDSETIRVTWTE